MSSIWSHPMWRHEYRPKNSIRSWMSSRSEMAGHPHVSTINEIMYGESEAILVLPVSRSIVWSVMEFPGRTRSWKTEISSISMWHRSSMGTSEMLRACTVSARSLRRRGKWSMSHDDRSRSGSHRYVHERTSEISGMRSHSMLKKKNDARSSETTPDMESEWSSMRILMCFTERRNDPDPRSKQVWYSR